MDSIKKLELINSKNELLFEGIFGKKVANTNLMLNAQGGGYILNGNYTDIGVYSKEGEYDGRKLWISAQIFSKPMSCNRAV